MEGPSLAARHVNLRTVSVRRPGSGCLRGARDQDGWRIVDAWAVRSRLLSGRYRRTTALGIGRMTHPEQPPRRRPQYGEGRVALLQAVARVVARAGLRGLTYRAVAAEAGVSHGAVSLHFGSRDAMIREAHKYATASGISNSMIEPGTGDLGDFAAGLVSAAENDQDGQIFQYELMLESRRRSDLAPDVRRVYSEYAAAAGRELDRLGLGDDDALADLVAAALDGLVLHQCVGIKTREETERELQRLREMLTSLQAERKIDSP